MQENYRRLLVDYAEKAILAESFAAQAQAVKAKIEATQWFGPLAKEIERRSLDASDELKNKNKHGDDKQNMQHSAE